jgi:hypothetical protein
MTEYEKTIDGLLAQVDEWIRREFGIDGAAEAVTLLAGASRELLERLNEALRTPMGQAVLDALKKRQEAVTVTAR